MASSDPAVVHGYWTTTAYGDDRAEDYNVGYCTDEFLIADIDTKHDPRALEIYHDELLGDFDTLEVTTASGGRHLIYSNPERDARTIVRLEGLPIDIKAVGGLAVAPGSVFEGGTYRLAADRPIKLVPAHIKNRVGRPRERNANPNIPLADLDSPLAIDQAVRIAQAAPGVREGGRGSACLKLALQMRDFGVTLDTAKEILRDHWADRCDPPFPFHDGNGVEGVDTSVEHAYEYAQNQIGSKSAEHVFAGIQVQLPPDSPGQAPIGPYGIPPANGAGSKGPPGLPFATPDYPLVCTDKGAPIPVLGSVIAIFRHERDFESRFALNEFTRTPEILPYRRPVDDIVISGVQEILQLKYSMQRVSFATVRQAIMMRAAECRYHPVKDFFASLAWDGVPRLATWLHTYAGVEQNAYHEKVGVCWIIAMVARIEQPGCQVDYIPTLISPQGRGKSRLAATFGGQWFSDSIGDIRSKDAAQHLNGKFVVELPELSALSKASIEAVKAFATRRREIYRRPYDSLEVDEPRQCTFVATTNVETPFRDPTGGRRFWPIAAGEIDLAALARDRDQLFAEAIVLYRRGQPWYPDRDFEATIIRPQQERRLEADPWEGPVLDLLHKLSWRPCEAPPWPRPRVTLPGVAHKALMLSTDRLGTTETRRITAIIQRAGWVPGRTNTTRFWELPGGWIDPHASGDDTPVPPRPPPIDNPEGQ